MVKKRNKRTRKKYKKRGGASDAELDACNTRLKVQGVKNIVKSDEDPSLKLVQWFKSVIDGNLILKPEKSGLNEDKNENKPAKNFFEDCANDRFFNISNTLTLNEKGQYEGQGSG